MSVNLTDKFGFACGLPRYDAYSDSESASYPGSSSVPNSFALCLEVIV